MSAGMKAYVREVVARLPRVAPDLEFAVVSNDDGVLSSVNGTSSTAVALGESAAANASWGEQSALPRLMRATGAALAHFMSVYAPIRSRLPYVYTIHDLIHKRYPRYFSWKIPVYYAFVVGPVARRARAVLTDAAPTIHDLTRYLGVMPERVRVVPLGVSERFAAGDARRARERWQLERPFFLYAGNHRPHKNLATLAAAWHAMEEPCDLVITEDGPLGFASNSFEKSNGKIVAAGRISTRELADLYAACTGVVQPSLYEGFGLSVLEAMSAGAPVVIAQTPVLLEVAGGAALSFPPRDQAALGRALTVLLRDPSTVASLRERGQRRAADFNWDETARKTAAAYREFLLP